MSDNTTNKIGLINLPEMPESADNAMIKFFHNNYERRDCHE